MTCSGTTNSYDLPVSSGMTADAAVVWGATNSTSGGSPEQIPVTALGVRRVQKNEGALSAVVNVLNFTGNGVGSITVSGATANVAIPAFDDGSQTTFVFSIDDLPAVDGSGNYPLSGSYYFFSDIDIGDASFVPAASGGSVNISAPAPTSAIVTNNSAAKPLFNGFGNFTLWGGSYANLGGGEIFDLSGSGVTDAFCFISTCTLFEGIAGAVGNYINMVFEDVFITKLAQGFSVYGNNGFGAVHTSLIEDNLSGFKGFEFASGVTFSGRFRVDTSIFNDASGTTGIVINNASGFSTEGFEIVNCEAFGSGAAYSGVAATSNNVNYRGNRGFPNTKTQGAIAWLSGATATTFGATNTFVKASGTTVSALTPARFTYTNNRLTYVGATQRDFTVTAAPSGNGGNNQEVAFRIAVNGTTIATSEARITTTGSGRASSCLCQAIVTLNPNDYVELFVANTTSTASMTVEFGSIMVREI